MKDEPVNRAAIFLLQPHQLDEFLALIALFETVFELPPHEPPSRAHLQRLLARQDFMVVVASVGGKIVGGLTCYTWDQYHSEKKLAYVYDLAVAPEFQRQGIGRLLMTEVQAICRRAGYEEVFVQADKDDGHALDFYRATGATEEDVSHFYYRL
jgi:aminoglycoside 3-N-acetyltransferase I